MNVMDLTSTGHLPLSDDAYFIIFLHPIPLSTVVNLPLTVVCPDANYIDGGQSGLSLMYVLIHQVTIFIMLICIHKKTSIS